MVAGGIRTEYGYDSRNRLRTLIKKSVAGVFMLGMTYTVDASGMRTSVEETDANGITRSVTWQYDALKRLTREAIDHRDDANDRVSSWTFDDVGNRLTQIITGGTAAATSTTSYAYDVNDRLLIETSDGAETRYTYDDNGNTLTKTTGAATVEYDYDNANRLVELRKANGDKVTYVNSADGLRVRQTIVSDGSLPTTMYYVHDSAYAYAEVVEEWKQEGHDARRLATTYNHQDDLISQTHHAPSGAPATWFLHADGFGSTRRLTKADGAVTDTIDYDAYGVETPSATNRCRQREEVARSCVVGTRQ